jgi:hypothetical protein
VPGAENAPTGQILDPATVAWRRTFTADGYDMAIFQPQISTWKGNQLAGRFAVGVRPTGSKDEAYGVVSFTARTEIDKPNRLVTLEDLEIGKVNFPTESAKEAEYLALLKKHLPEKAKTIPLDHLESVFVVSGEVEKQAEVGVKNDPPRIIYATQPAVLVLVDGPPVLKPLDEVYDRVINTRAILLFNKLNSKYYCYAARKWYNAHSIDGPFKSDPDPPADIQPALRLALATKKVDPMFPADNQTPPLISTPRRRRQNWFGGMDRESWGRALGAQRFASFRRGGWAGFRGGGSFRGGFRR